MSGDAKPITQNEKLWIYEVKTAAIATNALVDSLNWPSSVPTLVLNFSVISMGAYKTIEKNLTGKYMARLIYCVDKNKLHPAESAGPCPQISEYEFANIEELKELYLETEQKYFGAPWRGKLGYPWEQYLQGKYLEIIRTNAEKHLPLAEVICYSKSGRPVALLPLNKARYFDGRDIDWITWVWIDPSLNLEERREIRRRFIFWLKGHATSRIATGVNTFNAASNRFFEKIGFKPECVQITRPS